MANPFGGPTAKGSFLTGLGSSIMRQLAEQYDRTQQEEKDEKLMDYQLLMKGMEAMHDDLTPSQVGEILGRGVDIFKPKGHGGIKENLKDLFGKHQPYQMQGGSILQQVAAEPKKQVGTEQVVPQRPSVLPDWAKPEVPQQPVEGGERPIYEQTYREQGIQDEVRKQELMLQRQEALLNARTEAQSKLQKERSQLTVDRFARENNIRDKASAEREILKAAAVYGDPYDPANQERARIDLQAMQEAKQKDLKLKAIEREARIDDIARRDKDRQVRQQIALHRLKLAEQNAFLKDPQVQQMDSKIKEYTNAAGASRRQEAQAYANATATPGAGGQQWLEAAQKYGELAKKDEDEAQAAADGKQSYLEWLAGGKGKTPGGGGKGKKTEDPTIRAYADAHFNGDYAKAEEYAKKHP